MTTKIYRGQMERAPASLWLESPDAIPAALPDLLAEHRHVLLAGGPAQEPDKAAGVSPLLLDRIARAQIADLILIEADGSRRMPLKAPAAHEPVIPTSATHVVPVAGMDAAGRPLTPEYVHRPELVAAITGAAPGSQVTPQVIAHVLAHPRGGLQGVPAGALVVPVLNKVEGVSALETAREIASLLLAEPRIAFALAARATGPGPVIEAWGRVGAVVLAAGQGRRFGGAKQLMPWPEAGGPPLVVHVARQALACSNVSSTVVTHGAAAGDIAAALADLPVRMAHVEDWEAGQSRSVQVGLRALRDVVPHLQGALFLLADQPGVSPALLDALVQLHRETLAPVVAPRHAGRRGNPVLFDAATFPEFERLSGDIGARPILQAHAAEIAWLDWPSPEVLQDIDTREDYEGRVGG